MLTVNHIGGRQRRRLSTHCEVQHALNAKRHLRQRRATISGAIYYGTRCPDPDPGRTFVSDPDSCRTFVSDPDPGRTFVSDPDPGRTIVSDPDPGRKFASFVLK